MWTEILVSRLSLLSVNRTVKSEKKEEGETEILTVMGRKLGERLWGRRWRKKGVRRDKEGSNRKDVGR